MSRRNQGSTGSCHWNWSTFQIQNHSQDKINIYDYGGNSASASRKKALTVFHPISFWPTKLQSQNVRQFSIYLLILKSLSKILYARNLASFIRKLQPLEVVFWRCGSEKLILEAGKLQIFLQFANANLKFPKQNTAKSCSKSWAFNLTAFIENLMRISPWTDQENHLFSPQYSS